MITTPRPTTTTKATVGAIGEPRVVVGEKGEAEDAAAAVAEVEVGEGDKGITIPNPTSRTRRTINNPLNSPRPKKNATGEQ